MVTEFFYNSTFVIGGAYNRSSEFRLQTKDANYCVTDTLILVESVNCSLSFELFSNPNNGHFNILLRSEEISEVELIIFNALGQKP